MSATEVKQLNGFDLAKFQETGATIQESPEAGKLTWRGRLVWDAGFAGNAHVEEIEQLGQVIKRKFILRGDHPPELLGHNTGPTAVEVQIAALGSCVMGTFAMHATAKGIKVDELEVEIEGKIDLNGFLQLQDIYPGLTDVKLNVRVKADADKETLQELLEISQKASPIFNTVTNPVKVESSLI